MFVLVYSKPLQMFQLALFFPYRNRCRHTVLKKKKKKRDKIHHLPTLDRQRTILSLSHALHNTTKSMKTPLRAPRDSAHAWGCGCSSHLCAKHLDSNICCQETEEEKQRLSLQVALFWIPWVVFVFLPRPSEGMGPWRWCPFREALSLGKGRQTPAGPLSERSYLQNFRAIHRI